jgi:hypothetical protein
MLVAKYRATTNEEHFRGGNTMQEVTGRVAVRCAASDLCRAALARGPLIRNGNSWRYGRRQFSNATVKRLIDEGVAIRVGTSVTAAGQRLEAAD